MTSDAIPATKELTPAGYRRLLARLRRVIETGRQRAEAAVARELVQTYHRVGSLIVEGLAGQPAYGQAVLQRLADDLGLGLRVLQQAVAFARAYPEAPPHGGLRWAHYRELIRVTDPRQRAWYEQRAADQGWSRLRLVEAIREQRFAEPADESALASRERPPALPRPQTATYVYKATVERVVDGDTLLLLIDLGFQVLKRQRVRLAAIDAPPRDTTEGARARTLVEDALATVPFVMIKTEKIDLYGRYVAHLFFDPAEPDGQAVFARGRYLNQLLVDRGLATPLRP